MMKSILKEIKSIALTAAYFAVVFILLIIMKTLYLKDYNIEFKGMSQAIIGALIMAKVVILMKLISLGKWVDQQPPIVDVILRTLLYSAGALVVIILERAFEKRHEAGGFGSAISYVIEHRDMYHVWATVIGASISLFIYNSVAVLQRRLGKNGLKSLFFNKPLSQVTSA